MSITAVEIDPTLRVWWAPFAALREFYPRALAVLSGAEDTRRRGYAFAEDAERFVLGRWLLRVAIAAWPAQSVSPVHHDGAAGLELRDAAGEKPVAYRAGRKCELAYSLSRSAHYAVAGTGEVEALGVDVEDDERAEIFSESLIKEFFALNEQVMIAESADNSRNDRLLASWTGKEAIVKASGFGLRAPLQAIELHGETVVALPPLLGSKERCQLRLRKLTGASMAVAWW